MDSAKALREAAKVGDVDKLRELLANCSPEDVNTGEPKHGYRPLHYGKSLLFLAHQMISQDDLEQPPCSMVFSSVEGSGLAMGRRAAQLSEVHHRKDTGRRSGRRIGY